MNASKATVAGVAAAIVALSAAAVVYARHVPDVVGANAPPTVFSGERAMLHAATLARTGFRVASLRNNGAREYVVQQLQAIGLQPVIQATTGVGTRYRVAGPVQNVLARVPGRQPGGPAVLLMAHYDAVPASPGAGDDGSGTATLLETLRAIRAGPPLEHDVIALFTDHEEAGLLGAAAFVREHPWAKDVAVVMNFEARGTNGPSLMFETGPGNLDVVRVLRHVRGVRATSLSTAVYRQLPNDTDLSELALLSRPALNFAFIGGVERYHTAEDDAEHLDPRSVQHHGNQALALTRLFANGALPRPQTSDATFFNFPLLGLIAYPEPWAAVFALLALVLAVLVIGRARRRTTYLTRGTSVGVGATLLSVILCAVCAVLVASALQSLHGSSPTGGKPEWSGVYATAVALLCVAITAAIYALSRRIAEPFALFAGAVLFWALIAALATLLMPGAGFVFTWPVVVVAVGALIDDRWERTQSVGTWIGSAIAIFVVVPIVYLMACTALGVVGPGAAIIGIFAALVTWLFAPHLELFGQAGGGGTRLWRAPTFAAVASLVLFAIGATTVRTTARHPGAADLIYAVDADSNAAWLTGIASSASARAALLGVLRYASAGRATGTPPNWLPFGSRYVQGTVVSAPFMRAAPPSAEIVSDASDAGGRRVSMRVRPGVARLSVVLSADPGLVQSAAVNGKAIDTTRYRGRSGRWNLEYVNPTEDGFTVDLELAAGAHGMLTLRGVAAGIPPVPELRLPRRPEHVIPIQSGDVTWIVTRVRL